MPWRDRTPEQRRRDNATYASPEYLRNRKLALRRANGRCERCGRRARLQVDHVIPVAQGGSHALANLQALCSGPGSCHAHKTAVESHDREPADPQPRPRTVW